MTGYVLPRLARTLRYRNYVEIALRVILLFVSIYQWLVITSKTGTYCAETLGILHFESQWMKGLIISQVLKMIIFRTWKKFNRQAYEGFSEKEEIPLEDDSLTISSDTHRHDYKRAQSDRGAVKGGDLEDMYPSFGKGISTPNLEPNLQKKKSDYLVPGHKQSSNESNRSS